MKNVFELPHAAWFGTYMVEKRACIEPNFHAMYIQFLDDLQTPLLQQFVLLKTYTSIKSLLNNENTVSLSTDRTLLKNLGAWLGAITLSKNIPVKFNNIAFKDLLLEGYDHNWLIVAIPFVCKVLEQSVKSTLFKPPNPWLMHIMSVLAELYHFAELKLNLKFEIEVLCKALHLYVKEITPTHYLRERPVKSMDGLDIVKVSEFSSIGLGFPFIKTIELV